MAIKITLEDIAEATEKTYGNVEIDNVPGVNGPVVLRNAIRLPKKDRDALMAIQDVADSDDVDQEAMMKDMLRIIAASEKQAEALFEWAGDDLARLAEVFNQYQNATSLGEASPSQD